MGCRPFLVPLTGVEPVRLLQRGILSPLCLPIPPQRQIDAGHSTRPFCYFTTAFSRRQGKGPPRKIKIDLCPFSGEKRIVFPISG